MADASEAVVEVIAKLMKVPRSEVRTDVPFKELGADSLLLLECGLMLEEEFNIDVSDDAFRQFKTVQDIIDHVDAQAAGIARPGTPPAPNQDS